MDEGSVWLEREGKERVVMTGRLASGIFFICSICSICST